MTKGFRRDSLLVGIAVSALAMASISGCNQERPEPPRSSPQAPVVSDTSAVSETSLFSGIDLSGVDSNRSCP